jgi:Zn-dependent protease with chaperone function
LAIALWQACGLSVVLALVAVITVSLLPADEARTNLSLTSCLAVFTHRLSRAHLLTPTALLAGAAALALLRVAFVVARRARDGSRVRREQRDGLDLLGPSTRHSRAHVLHAERPLAYSVPGDGGRVVVTSGALALLNPDEVAAVVAHERAHLRGRHHLVLMVARAARDLLPHSQWVRRAHGQVAELLELAADDQAARATGAGPVARAVAVLGGPSAQDEVAVRVWRLNAAQPRLRAPARIAVGALAALLVGLPASAAAAPVALAHVAHHQT